MDTTHIQKSLNIDSSIVPPLATTSENGHLTFNKFSNWVASYDVKIFATDAMKPELLKLANKQLSLWSANSSSMSAVFYVSNMGDMMIAPVSPGMPIIFVNSKSSKNIDTEDSLSQVDWEVHKLSIVMGQAASGITGGSLTLTLDGDLRKQHSKDSLNVGGLAGVLAAMVLDGALSYQVATYIFYIWKKTDHRWVPSNMTFKQVLAVEREKARQVDYFWRRSCFSTYNCPDFLLP